MKSFQKFLAAGVSFAFLLTLSPVQQGVAASVVGPSQASVLGGAALGVVGDQALSVSGLMVQPDDASVILFWDIAKDADGKKLSKYEVSYGKKSVENGLATTYEKTISVDDPKAPTLGIARTVIEGLENGQNYYFAVKAINGRGEKSSEYSEEISAIPSKDASKVGSTSAPQVETAEAITKNIVKVVFSKNIVLPKEKAEFAFTITEEDKTENTLTVKKVSYRTNYFLDPIKEKTSLVEMDKILYLETTEAQKKGTKYVVTVSSAIVDENKKPINSASTDSASFTGTDVTTLPESEKPVASVSSPSPSASATPSPSVSASPTVSPSATPDPNEKTVPVGAGTELSFLDGEVKIQLSKNSTEGTIRVEKSTGTPSSFVLKSAEFERKALSTVYDLSFKDANTKRTFSGTITITPAAADITKSKILASELAVFFYNEQKKTWENASGKVSSDGKSIAVVTDHFSQWVVGSETLLHSAAEDKTPPEEVMNFTLSMKASIENFLINLSWKKSIDTAGDLAVQMLYKSIDNGKTWDKGQEIKKDIEKFTITGQPEKEYSLKITTKDKNGNESAGIIKTIKLPALPASGAPLFLVLGAALFFGGASRLRKEKPSKK